MKNQNNESISVLFANQSKYIKQKEKEIDGFHSRIKKIGSAKKLAQCASEINAVLKSDREL